jgi:hypothetical protein
MGVTLEVYDSGSGQWVDKTLKTIQFRHSLTSRELEKVEFTLVNDDVGVGQKVRVKRDNIIFFEGIIYERRKRHDQNYVSVEATAYSNLILYDRHVVYRAYQTGTTAGAIIKDLASLESGVNVTNVDDGPSLLSNWEIENENALKIMQDVAKGVNYWLRMKPGNYLYFKPKTTGNPVATIDSSKILRAEYSEDRWRLKNRVIYVGANGEILADVSEGAGDLPEVVHDLFLTDKVEAQRRANIRLALNKEYGRQLRIEMSQYDFEAMNLDLGDTVTVNLPSLGLSNVNMFLLEVEYDPRELRYSLTLGGKLELFEELFEETIGGDVASRFGQSIKVPEMISTIYTSMDLINMAVKIQANARTLRIYNKPPLVLENAQNVILDEDGCVKLIAGAMSGSFEFSFLPQSSLFSRWLRIHYDYEKNDGEVRADVLRADDSVIDSNIPEDYDFPYIPEGLGAWTEGNANEWSSVNASVSDSSNAVISRQSIKAVKTGSGAMKLIYPYSRNLKLDLSKHKYMQIYLYSDESDQNLKIRLKQDEDNYYEATLNHSGGVWRRYQILLSSFQKIGSPSLTNINYLEIETTMNTVNVDSDVVFIPLGQEKVRVKFTLTRPSASTLSPRVKLVKLVWREGG